MEAKKINNKNTVSELTDLHKEDMGYQLPKDYFKKSKNEILSQVKDQKKVISIKPQKWMLFAAASVVILLSISVFNYRSRVNNILPSSERIAMLDEESEALITSLLILEEETDLIDEYIDHQILEGL